MARAAPQLAIMAILVISVLLNSAFVATTPMVVLWKIRSSDPNALRRVARGGVALATSAILTKPLPSRPRAPAIIVPGHQAPTQPNAITQINAHRITLPHPRLPVA